MDWLMFGAIIAQALIVFLLAMGCYSAFRSANRRERDRDLDARRKGER